MNRPARPIAARIQQVDSSGITHCHDLESDLPGQQTSLWVLASMVAAPSVNQDHADLAAIRPARNSGGVPGLVNIAADVPLHTEGLDAYSICTKFLSKIFNIIHELSFRQFSHPGENIIYNNIIPENICW